MQLVKRLGTPQPVILAAAILGGCIVLAAVILSTGPNHWVSPLSQWSMSNQLDAQLQKALGGQVTVAGTECRLDGIAIAQATLRDDGSTLVLVYVTRVYPLKLPAGTYPMEGRVTGESVLSKRADGTFAGLIQVGDCSAQVVVR